MNERADKIVQRVPLWLRKPRFSILGLAFWGAIGAAVAVLVGCSAIPGYNDYRLVADGYVDQTIQDRINYNDKKSQVIRALNCDMSLGAFARMPEGDVKRGVALICGIHLAP